MFRKISKGLKVAREPGFRPALRNGVAATIEHDSIPLPRDLAHVIDVGANRGQFLTWASVRFPEAKFDCFEPFEESRTQLAAVAPGNRDVAIHPFALGDSNEEREFHVTQSDDSSSLLEPSSLQTEKFPESVIAQRIQVPVKRLDEILEGSRVSRPALLKIDVQGGELDVLRGGSRVLQSIDLVVVECSFAELYVGQALAADVIDFMASAGFLLSGLYSPTLDEQDAVLQADAFFVRRNLRVAA